MSRAQLWIATSIASLALALMAASVTLQGLNRSLQSDINLRQQYVAQSMQLETLYREIIRALAEAGARNNDQQVREMLARHGITYTVNAPTAAQPVKK